MAPEAPARKCPPHAEPLAVAPLPCPSCRGLLDVAEEALGAVPGCRLVHAADAFWCRAESCSQRDRLVSGVQLCEFLGATASRPTPRESLHQARASAAEVEARFVLERRRHSASLAALEAAVATGKIHKEGDLYSKVRP